MGFSLPLGKERKIRKLIGNYVKDRVREKRTFDEQIRRLDAQLAEGQTNQLNYDTFRVILETRYYQRQEEEWTNIKNKFQNTFNS